MLKRLRWRFILFNMLLVGVAFLVLFSAVCVVSYRTGKADVDQAIETAERRAFGAGMQTPPDRFDGNGPRGDGDVRLPTIGGKEEMSFVYTVTVVVNSEGNYFRGDAFGAEANTEILDKAVKTAMASGKVSGSIRSLNLAWKKVSAGEMTTIIFASTDHLWSGLRTTALTTGGVLLGGLVLFFGISYLLSGVVIRPTAQAWEQQKRFVADASHDLKTPVTVILANTQILQSAPEAPPEERAKWLEGIAEEGERMKGMINEMLELAQTEQVEKQVFSPVNLSDATERTLLQMEPLAFEKGVLIESEIEPAVSVPGIEKNYVRLLYILVDNAVKYCPAGEAVKVALARSGSGAVLTVQNKGEEIPAEELPHIFERFWRADKARETTGGFGLGLSIAKNLADGLRAKISVASEQGQTTFTVRL